MADHQFGLRTQRSAFGRQSSRLSRHDGRRGRVQGGRHAVHRQFPGLWLLPRRRTEPERDDGGQFQGGVRLDPANDPGAKTFIIEENSSRLRFRRPNRSAFRRRTWCRSIRPSAAAVMRLGSYPRPRRNRRFCRNGAPSCRSPPSITPIAGGPKTETPRSAKIQPSNRSSPPTTMAGRQRNRPLRSSLQAPRRHQARQGRLAEFRVRKPHRAIERE